MQFFGTIELGNGTLDDKYNFATFGSTMFTLWIFLTAEGWDNVLEDLMVKPPFCSDNSTRLPDGTVQDISGCGLPLWAPIFMGSFEILFFIILVNMFVAVIVDNYSEANEEEEIGITEEDIYSYFQKWEVHDPDDTEFIDLSKLGIFASELEPPLGLPPKNQVILAFLNIAIYEGEQVHCLDVAFALLTRVIGEVETSEIYKAIKEEINKKLSSVFVAREAFKKISTTQQRKKEDLAARTLQRAWRTFKNRRLFRLVAEVALAEKQQLTRRPSSDGAAPVSYRRPSFEGRNNSLSPGNISTTRASETERSEKADHNSTPKIENISSPQSPSSRTRPGTTNSVIQNPVSPETNPGTPKMQQGSEKTENEKFNSLSKEGTNSSEKEGRIFTVNRVQKDPVPNSSQENSQVLSISEADRIGSPVSDRTE